MPKSIAPKQLPERPSYFAGTDVSPGGVAGRLRKGADEDGPADYANRIQVEILAQLVAIRRHLLLVSVVLSVSIALLALTLLFGAPAPLR